MQVLSLVWGILAIIGMLVAFFPCLGSFNWLNIPFSGLGLIFCVFALLKAEPTNKNKAVVGIILCAIAVLFGIIRLYLGGGIV